MPPKIHKGKSNNEGQKENGDLSARDNVLVCVRMRPLNRKERKSNQKIAWKIDGNNISSLGFKGNKGLAPKIFSYDQLWAPGITNEDIFAKIGFSVVKTTMEGYHGVVFAYGQTSAGKTHSIHGGQDDPGMIPRAVQAMFEYIENTTDRDFLIQVSYMEIYNEIINDLLNPEGINLSVREDPKKGIHVANLKKSTVMSIEQIYALLAQGESHRHIGKTNYNDSSSRSHTIFQVAVESQSNLPTDKVVLQSKLSLVDLAGSEDTAKAGLDKKAETGNINKSLLALASVIWKISEPKTKRTHIPYRDSKLTRVLQESLNGSACISVLCCISPSSGNVDESISTLKFASRAKLIKNTAKKNTKQADAKTLIAKYKAEIEDLKNRLLNAEVNGVGQVAASVAPSQVSISAIEEHKRKSAQEIQGYKTQIEHLNKIILKSPFQGGLSKNELLSGTTKGQNFRRPSYFNMGACLGPTGFQNSRPRRQSAFTFGTNLTVMDSQFVPSKKPNKRLIRSGSLGLCDETGNEEIDDLLCLPAKAEVYFEKEKTKQMKEKLSEKSEQVQGLYEQIAELNGILQEKNAVIANLQEELEDQRQEMKTKEFENETYLETIREYESLIEDYEKQGTVAEVAAPKKKKKPVQWEDIKSFNIILGIRSRRTGIRGSDSGPVIAFFKRNEETGNYEFEGRTEWVKDLPDPVFNRTFVVQNNPDLNLRFSAYDADSQEVVDEGAFLGVIEFPLKKLIDQFDNKRDEFIELKLETDNNEDAWLRFKLKPQKKKSKSKKNRIIQLEEEIGILKKRLGDIK